MLRRQPRSARRASITAMICGFAVACLLNAARGTDSDLMSWLGPAAARPRDRRADKRPALAGRELLNRALHGAPTQSAAGRSRAAGGLNFGLSFDPALQPRYDLSATQPLLARGGHETAIDLHGQVAYDTSGRMDGILPRYHSRWRDRGVSLDVQGGMDHRQWSGCSAAAWALRGASAHLRCAPTCMTTCPRTGRVRDPEARAGWLRPRGEGSAALSVRGARAGQPLLAARGRRRDRDHRRSPQPVANPLLALEVQTDTHSQPEERTWFTQLRWRVKLGGERPIGINRGALSPGGCTNAATCATRA